MNLENLAYPHKYLRNCLLLCQDHTKSYRHGLRFQGVEKVSSNLVTSILFRFILRYLTCQVASHHAISGRAFKTTPSISFISTAPPHCTRSCFLYIASDELWPRQPREATAWHRQWGDVPNNTARGVRLWYEECPLAVTHKRAWVGRAWESDAGAGYGDLHLAHSIQAVDRHVSVCPSGSASLWCRHVLLLWWAPP